jgi:hypothetical protein
MRRYVFIACMVLAIAQFARYPHNGILGLVFNLVFWSVIYFLVSLFLPRKKEPPNS